MAGINVGPGGNAGGYGMDANAGQGVLSKYGANIQGGTVVSTSGIGVSGAGNRVYMGKTGLNSAQAAKEERLAGVKVTGSTDSFMDLQAARNLPLEWARNDPKKLREFVNKGIAGKIRGFDVDMGMPEIMSAWDDIVTTSVAFSKSGQNWSPWDVLASYGQGSGKFGTQRKGDWEYDVATGKPVKYVGPKSKTTTAKRIDLSSAEDVKALTMQVLREALGRAPTDEEVAKFKASINSLENANPEVSTTTVQLTPNIQTGEVEQTSSSTTTSGGVSQDAMADLVRGTAEQTPEYAKFQGANYFNDLLAMIGGG